MKVVVTGGSGKVGRHVVRALKDEGMQVVNLDRADPPERLCWTWRMDLADAASVFDAMAQIRPDAVVHAAASPSPHGEVRHRQWMQNVGIAHSVFQSAADLGVRKIVYLSSEQASGWTSTGRAPSYLPMTENDVTDPANVYSLSKKVGEELLAMVCAAEPETSGVSLRINYVQLPEEATPDRVARMSSRNEWPSPNLWGWVDARDVAAAVLAGLRTDRRGHRAYLINAEETFKTIPTRELVARWFPESRVADSVGEFGALLDCSRANEELGWRPIHRWSDYPALVQV